MESEPGGQLTGLLQAWSRGDTDALDQLAPLLQAELRILARRVLAGEQSGNGWQATELVHESYLRLIGWQKSVQWQNRAHFFATTATIMRRVLVDAARARKADQAPRRRRAACRSTVSIRQRPSRPSTLSAIGDALTVLAEVAPRASRVVELRFFGGFSLEETAEALGVSVRTVNNDWNTARAWLSRELARRE